MFIKDKLIVTAAIIVIFVFGAFVGTVLLFEHSRLNGLENAQNVMASEITKFAQQVNAEIQQLKPEKK